MSTAIAAPSAAPEAVPSTYGSASGLRSRPWNVAPATARPVPTTIAVRTRGSRRSRTIASEVGGQVTGTWKPIRLSRMPMVVDGGRSTDPSAIPTTNTTASTTIPATTSHPVRVTRRTVTRMASRPGVPAGTGVVVIVDPGRSAGRHGAADAEAHGPGEGAGADA